MSCRINSTSAGSGAGLHRLDDPGDETGTIQFVRSRVVTGCSPPITSTAAAGRAISSHASRMAASTGPSPSSIRPPGKTTSPGWVRVEVGSLGEDDPGVAMEVGIERHEHRRNRRLVVGHRRETQRAWSTHRASPEDTVDAHCTYSRPPRPPMGSEPRMQEEGRPAPVSPAEPAKSARERARILTPWQCRSSVVLETPRLLLRPYRRRDVASIHDAVVASWPDLVPWLPWATGYSRNSASQFVRESQSAWQEGRAFDFTIRQVSTSTDNGLGPPDPERHLGGISIWWLPRTNLSVRSGTGCAAT